MYLALGQVAPEELAKPIKRQPERAYQIPPSSLLKINVDGLDSSYFEWLGAGVYSPERRGGAMHGRVFALKELRYGFEEDRFVIRVDCFTDILAELEDPEFRITIGAVEEVAILVKLERNRTKEFSVEVNRICLMHPDNIASAEFHRILEVAISREVLDLRGLRSFPSEWLCGIRDCRSTCCPPKGISTSTWAKKTPPGPSSQNNGDDFTSPPCSSPLQG